MLLVERIPIARSSMTPTLATPPIEKGGHRAHLGGAGARPALVGHDHSTVVAGFKPAEQRAVVGPSQRIPAGDGLGQGVEILCVGAGGQPEERDLGRERRANRSDGGR